MVSPCWRSPSAQAEASSASSSFSIERLSISFWAAFPFSISASFAVSRSRITSISAWLHFLLSIAAAIRSAELRFSSASFASMAATSLVVPSR